MGTKFALLANRLFHPAVMWILGLGLFALSVGTFRALVAFAVVSGICIVSVLIALAPFHTTGMHWVTTNLTHEERRAPRFISVLMAGFALAFLTTVVTDGMCPLRIYLGGSAVLSFIAYLITLKVKLSIHLAMSALIFVVAVSTFGQSTLLAAPLLAFVGWSRLYLKAHTIRELLVGLIMGLGGGTLICLTKRFICVS
jgi:membrane-associated phospholipid phosphatase